VARSRLALVLGGIVLLGTAAALLYTGHLHLNHPNPRRFPIRGIDVSHHQGTIDWARLPREKVRFAFIKASEGRDHVDPAFAWNWQAADSAGIPRGAYHFFTFCQPGRDQAEHFLRVAPPAARQLPPVADVEFVGNCAAPPEDARIAAELRDFVAVVSRAHGRPPILYVTRASARRIVKDRFPHCPIWIRDVFLRPHRPWLFWQFADRGRLDGIAGFVDLNVFAGDAAHLAALNATPPSGSP
jgi:lysozyme